MRKFFSIIFAAAVVAAASSCVKDGFEEGGGTIRFGVSTVYENGPATKTEYSGKDQNNNNISSTSTAERINWLSTDKIRILCSQASVPNSTNKYADYQIVPGSTSGKNHSATIKPADGNGLQWGTGTHYFYALYPAQTQNPYATITPDTATKAKVNGKILHEQNVTLSGHVFKPDMNYAYMYAFVGRSPEADAQLNFKPLVTALEFTLLTQTGNAITSKLTSVKLSSTQTSSYLAGTFTATLTTSGLTALTTSNITNGKNEITITLPNSGVQLSTTNPYTVTFLTLPMNQTNLTLTLGFADGTKRTLELKNNDVWITADACKKTYIWKLDAPLTTETYVFSATNPTDLVYSGGSSTTGKVVSYKYINNKDIPANRTPIAWNVEGYYSTAEDAQSGTNKIDITGTQLTSYTPESTNGSYSGESVTINYKAVSSPTHTPVDLSSEITQKLRSNTGAYVRRGNSSSPWNLSNPATGSRDHIAETANTYIVNAPGYYCFPLVLGNGIKNDDNNRNAYRYMSSYPATFNNKYTNSSSFSPLLNDLGGGTPSNAFIVWAEADMVNLTDRTDWTLPSGCITTSSMTIGSASKTVYWLNFQITNDIQQGCIVIAVTNGTQIMWSWNIWVTDYVPANYDSYDPSSDLADITCSYYPYSGNTTTANITFMPYNLGWVEGVNATNRSFPESRAFVRLNQTGTDNYTVMEVKRPGTSMIIKGGHCPFYQWGRKDPFLPSDGTKVNNGGTTISPVYGKNSTFQYQNSTSSTNMVTSILNPHIFYVNSGQDWYFSHNGTTTVALSRWTALPSAANEYDYKTIKTIFDPCPAGYTVPRYKAFLGFAKGTDPHVYVNVQEGYNYYTLFNELYGYNFLVECDVAYADESNCGTIFIPAAGCRTYSNPTIPAQVADEGYYWTAAISPNHGKLMEFQSGTVKPQSAMPRCFGAAIRPAREEE